MLMFADKVGGWGWPNADVSKKKVFKEKLLLGIFFETFFLCIMVCIHCLSNKDYDLCTIFQ